MFALLLAYPPDAADIRSHAGGERSFGQRKGSRDPGRHGSPLEGVLRACLGLRRGEGRVRQDQEREVTEEVGRSVAQLSSFVMISLGLRQLRGNMLVAIDEQGDHERGFALGFHDVQEASHDSLFCFLPRPVVLKRLVSGFPCFA